MTCAGNGESGSVFLEPTTVTHVLYHARCDDGFGSAFAAWQVLGDKAQYIPVAHGDPPPALPPDAIVAMIDFSYKRPVILDIKSRVKDMVVLDHHVTAQAELEGLEFARFDLSQSGAHMGWDFFHAGEPLPDLLAYIEDKDLWRFKLPLSKEVTAALRSYPMSFELWSTFQVSELQIEGKALLRLQDQLVTAAAQRARFEQVLGFDVPVLNASEYRSEVANRLCEMFPEAPFAAVYYDNEHGFRCWSLRSVGDFDVAALAEKVGGGGHVKAAGFVETVHVPPPPTAPGTLASQASTGP